MSDAIVSEGVLIQRGNGATPEVFTTIGEITDFDGPGGSASVIDTTSLESIAKEKLIGLPDEGQFSFNVNWLAADPGQTGLRADRQNRTKRNIKVIFTDAGNTEASFAAYVLSFSVSGAVDDKVSGAISLEITGLVDWS